MIVSLRVGHLEATSQETLWEAAEACWGASVAWAG